MMARTFFQDRLPRALAAAPALFDFDLVYRMTVTGDAAETWTVDLRGTPSCRSGVQGAADCELEIAEADLAALLEDPGLARNLFRSGRIRLGGRFDAALWFPALLRVAREEHVNGGMAALLGASMTLPAFMASWPGRLVAVDDSLARVPDIGAISALRSIDSLLDAWPGRVRLADKHGGRLVETEEARAMYRDGYHLAFGEVQRVFPLLDGWVERLRWELDLPISAYGRCHVYASPDGAGEGLHFDENVNLVLQLAGAKTWRVSPNDQVALPTTRYTTADRRIAPELAACLTGPLLDRLPEGAHAVTLVPGTLLVMPRGYWHETTAHGDSLSLNFTFDQPTWADVMGPAQAAMLKRQLPWRELARGAGSPYPEAARRAAEHLQALVEATPAVRGRSAREALGRLTPVETTESQIFAHGPREPMAT